MDPFSAYTGDINTHNNAAVRGLLNPIKDLLERQNVTLLANAHCNKNQAQEVLYRMSGSVGLIAAARMAMVVGKHPHDPDHRVLAMFKSNLSARARSLDYTLGDAGGFALTWHPNAPDIAPEELLRSPNEEEKTAIDEAAEFLSDYLAKGPAKQADVMRGARANGISEMTLRRAKKRLNVQTRKVGFGSNSYTEWSLPGETPKVVNVSGDHLYENIRKNVNQEKPVAPFASTDRCSHPARSQKRGGRAMTALELLATCRAAGVDLHARGGRLKYEAPVGALTPALRSKLKRKKKELLSILSAPPSVTLAPTGLALPLLVIQLAWDLEELGFEVTTGEDGALSITSLFAH